MDMCKVYIIIIIFIIIIGVALLSLSIMQDCSLVTLNLTF